MIYGLFDKVGRKRKKKKKKKSWKKKADQLETNKNYFVIPSYTDEKPQAVYKVFESTRTGTVRLRVIVPVDIDIDHLGIRLVQ